jgi:hypothetical protein
LIEINEETTETTRQLVAGVQKAHKELIASYTSKELETITDFLMCFTKNVKDHTEKIEKDFDK